MESFVSQLEKQRLETECQIRELEEIRERLSVRIDQITDAVQECLLQKKN